MVAPPGAVHDEPEQVSEDDISEVSPEAAEAQTPAEAPTLATGSSDAPASPSESPPASQAPPSSKLEDASGVESSVGASVADVDVTTALKQARRGRRTQIAVTLGAAAVILIGAGLGMHEQSGPEVRSSKAEPEDVTSEPSPPVPAAKPAPVTTSKALAATEKAPPPEPEPKAEPKSVIVRVHPLGAHIFDGTKKIAHTAVTLKLEPNEEKVLTLYLDGYWPRQVKVDGSAPEINVSMKEKSENAGAGATQAAASQKADEAAPRPTQEPKKAKSPPVSGGDSEFLPAL